MAIDNIRMGGINSGFDTEAMIEQMMSTYQTKIDNQQKKLTKLSWQQEAYQDITKKLTEFKSKYFDVLKRDSYLMSPATFSKFKANITSEGDKTNGLTATTTQNSLEGTYKIKVSQLASASKVQGASIMPTNFKLDFDKAIGTSAYSDATDDSGNTTRTYEFALDIQVGSVTKTVSFSAETALDADGNVADMDALKASMVDSLNAELQDAFGYSGRSGDAATGVKDAEGKEWFLQVEMGADGTVGFAVGGNTSVTVTEKSGNFGMTEPSQVIAVSMTSVITGKNAVAIDINGVSKNVKFNGVSSTYYDSREQEGNLNILAEYNSLKAAAYRKEYGLAEGTPLTTEQLDSFAYSSAQAAQDKNTAAFKEAVNNAFADEGYTFEMTGNNLIAKKNGSAVEFTMTSISGGTLGLTKGTSSNKFTASTALADLGLEPNTALGGYSIKINGEEISVGEDATISSLISAVNKSSAGVTMSYSALTNSFAITSNEFGGAGDIEIEGSDITKALGLTDENGDEIGFTAGQNSVVEINGEELYLNSNSYTLDGTTFSFTDEVEIGTTFTVGISKSYDDVKETIKSFVEDYNKLIDEVYDYIGTTPKRDSSDNLYEPLTDAEKAEMSEDEIKNWEEAAKTGILYNDSSVSKIMSEIRTVLYNSVTLEDGSKFGIFSMGIKTSSEYSDHGKLEIDESKFDAAFEKNPEAITKLFTDSTDGIMKKVNTILDTAVKTTGGAENRGTLVRKAGVENSSNITESSIYKEMQRIKERILDLQDRYNAREEYWWSVFTNMESMMSDLNSQTSYLSSYLA